MSTLQHEVGKKSPFDLPEQEAYLNLIRTAAVLEGPLETLLKANGLGSSSYNVLRILAGAGASGRTCGEILDDMVVRAPDVTRLVDRLIVAGLAERARDEKDRRLVLVRITGAGRALADRLRERVREVHRQQLGHLSRDDLNALNRLLVAARQARRTTAGKEDSR